MVMNGINGFDADIGDLSRSRNVFTPIDPSRWSWIPTLEPSQPLSQAVQDHLDLMRTMCVGCGFTAIDARQLELHRRICRVWPSIELRSFSIKQREAIIILHTYQAEQLLSQIHERGEIGDYRIFRCDTCGLIYHNEIMFTHHQGLHKILHE